MINWLIKSNRLYADAFKNAVFRYGKGAELRGTNSTKWQRCYGEISEPFIIPASSLQLVLTESAIDAISYRQLNNGVAVCSIAGANRYGLIDKVKAYASKNNHIIVCGFDNDKGGNEASKHLQTLKIFCRVKPKGKDWNDDSLFPKSN